MMLNQPMMQTTCTRCGAKFTAPAERVLDVEKDPNAKLKLLSGQVNIIRCPACGAEGVVNAPFIYHDRSKELLLAFMPQAFGRDEAERQRALGELTNMVMNSLPREQRKAYLLQPKMFFTLQSMIEAVLAADGVTKEMLDAQKAQVELINTLLKAPDAATFEKTLQQNKDKIDYGLFETLTASMEAAQLNGQGRSAQVLASLRQRLMQEFGLPVGEELAGEGSKGLLTRDRLIERLLETTDEDDFEQLVAIGRPLMDYGFFQEITNRMEKAEEAGDKARVKELSRLRAKTLEITEAMDAAAKQIVNQATELVQGAVQSEDPEAYLREHLEEITEAFFVVLSANMNAADRQGNVEAADRLEQIGEMALKLLQEATPPEIQFMNQLLSAAYPEETQRLLSEHADLVTPELLSAMNLISEDLSRQGNVAAADKLRKIIAQTQAVSAK